MEGMSRLDEGDAEPLGAGRGRNDGGVSRYETAIWRLRTGTRARFRTETSRPSPTAFSAPADSCQITTHIFACHLRTVCSTSAVLTALHCEPPWMSLRDTQSGTQGKRIGLEPV